MRWRGTRAIAAAGLVACAWTSGCNEVSGLSGLDFGSGGSRSAGATTAHGASSTSAGGTGGGAAAPPTAQELLALTTSCDVVSTSDYENDYDPMAADIPICGLTGAVFWKAGMSIDCDGKSHTSTKCPSGSGSTAATDSMGQALSSVDLPFVVLPVNSGCNPCRGTTSPPASRSAASSR